MFYSHKSSGESRKSLYNEVFLCQTHVQEIIIFKSMSVDRMDVRLISNSLHFLWVGNKNL